MPYCFYIYERNDVLMKKNLKCLAAGLLIVCSMFSMNICTALANESASESTASPRIASYGYANVVNCSSLTVRKGPGYNYSAVAYLKRGDTVSVMQNISDVSGWTYIMTEDGTYGFVGSSYLNPRYY